MYCRQTWAPDKQAGLPPKLTFFGARQERNLSPELTGSQVEGKWDGPMVCHDIRIDYDTRSQAVTVEVDGIVAQQQVQTRLGVPLEPWDMHIGAVLDLLGRKVTLASCNLAVRTTLLLRARAYSRRECPRHEGVPPQSTLNGTPLTSVTAATRAARGACCTWRTSRGSDGCSLRGARQVSHACCSCAGTRHPVCATLCRRR